MPTKLKIAVMNFDYIIDKNGRVHLLEYSEDMMRAGHVFFDSLSDQETHAKKIMTKLLEKFPEIFIYKPKHGAFCHAVGEITIHEWIQKGRVKLYDNLDTLCEIYKTLPKDSQIPILFDFRGEIRANEIISEIYTDTVNKLSEKNIGAPLIYNDTWLLNRFTNKVMPFVLDPKTEFFAPAVCLDFRNPQTCLAEIDAFTTDTVILKNVDLDNRTGLICIPKQQISAVFDILTNNNTQAIDKLDIDATAKLHLRLNCYLLHSSYCYEKTIIAMPLIESKRLTYNGQGYRATGRTSVMVIKNDNQYEISHINSAWQLPPNSFTDTTTASIISNESGYHVLPMENHDQQLVLNVLQRFFETNGEFFFLDKFYPWFKQKLDANDPVVKYISTIKIAHRLNEPLTQEILQNNTLMELPNYALFVIKMLSDGEIPEIELPIFKQQFAKLSEYEMYESKNVLSIAEKRFSYSTNENEQTKYNAFITTCQEVYGKPRKVPFEYLEATLNLTAQFANIGNDYANDLLKHYLGFQKILRQLGYTKLQLLQLLNKQNEIPNIITHGNESIYWQPLIVDKPNKTLQQTKDMSPEAKLALYCQWLTYYAAEPNTPYASIVITLSNIAMCCSKLEDFINAQRYFEIVVECFQKTEQTTAAINQCEKNLAQLGSDKKSIGTLIELKSPRVGFGKESEISEQEQQELQRKYKLTDMNKSQLEKGLRNAAANGYKNDLIKFIQLGAAIDASDMKHNKTALHHAVLKEHDECAKTLINCGARYQLEDSSRMTAYAYAKEKGSTVFDGVAPAVSEGKEVLTSEQECPSIIPQG